MNLKSKYFISTAWAVAALVAGAADRWDWTGAAGDNLYVTGGNWTFNSAAQETYPGSGTSDFIPGGNEVSLVAPEGTTVETGRLTLGSTADTYATPAKLTIGPGTYSFIRLNVGGDADIQSTVLNTSGELIIEEGANVTVKNSDGLRVAFSQTNTVGVASSVALNGGNLTLAGGNAQIGANARGNLTQTGGTLTTGFWFSLGRYAGGEGVYDLTGGTFKATNNDQFLIVGEDGRGTLNVSGTGVVDVVGELRIGAGTVNLGAGGTIKAKCFRPQGTGRTNVLNLDGGTLVMQGNEPTRTFIKDLAAVNLLAGGATFNVPAGYTAELLQPILGGETSGALVKTGAGTLSLPNGNTYAGTTEVREGTLLLASKTSLDLSKVTVASGASVCFVGATKEDILEQAAALDGGDLAVHVAANETLTLDGAIGANVANVVKLGAGTLVLTGANAFTGKVVVEGGLVRADIGAGVPATDRLQLAGGYFATLTDETLAGALEFVNMNPTFAAIDHALAVTMGTGAALVAGAETLPTGRVVLNTAAANKPLVFANPLQAGSASLAVEVPATGAETAVTLAGGVGLAADAAAGATFTKDGAGTLVVPATAPLKLSGHSVLLQGGTTILEGEGHEGGWTQIFDCNAKIVLSNATYTSSSEFLIGQGAGFKGEAYLYNSTLDVASWIAIGRFNGGDGYLRLDNGNVRVRSNNILVGNTGYGLVEQNSGSVLIDTGALLVGEYDNNDSYYGHGRYVLNGGELNCGQTDPCLTLGNYGLGEFVVNGGTLTLPTKTYSGRNAAGSGTFEVHGGTVNSVGEFRTGYRGANCVYEQDGGTFNATAGFMAAYEEGSAGDFRMSGGTLNAKALVSFGRKGPSRAEVSGGELKMAGVDNFVLGRYAAGTGDLTVSGGRVLFDSTAKTSYIGQEGKGSLTVAGDGEVTLKNTVWLGNSSSSAGTLRLGGDGVFAATKVNMRKGPRNFSANGGTIRALAGASGAFFVRASDGDGKDLTTAHLGPGGLTFDTGANAVTLCAVGADGTSAGALRKTGTGTLTLETFPYLGGGVAVQEGTVKLAENAAVGAALADEVKAAVVTDANVYPAEPSETLVANGYLSRRLTFDGSLTDALTGRTGTAVGAAVAGAKAYTLPGGGDQSAYLDLGAGYLPQSAYATMELWLTVKKGNNTWSKIFTFGSAQDNNWMLGCTHGDSGTPTATIDGANVDFATPAGEAWTWTDNTTYHVSIVIQPNAENAEQCDSLWTIRDVVTGDVLARAACTSARSLLNLGTDHCWFGRSEWADQVPSVTLHEFRVWEAALSQDQLTLNVARGANTLPTVTEVLAQDGVSAISLAAGTTFALNGNTLSGVGLAGAGTLAGPGTLVVAEKLAPHGTLTIAADANVKVTGTIEMGDGDQIVCNGTLDLTEATLVYTGTAQKAVLVTAANDGIVGPLKGFEATEVETKVSVKSGSVSVSNASAVMILCR